MAHNYYYSNVPYLVLWAFKYVDISKFHEDFLEQANKGTLPAVSFVDPRYTILDDGTGNDDHPHADIFVKEIAFCMTCSRPSPTDPRGQVQFLSSLSTNGADSSSTFRHPRAGRECRR